MSSEASTEPRASQPGLGTNPALEIRVDPGLRPWQFFLLAGMLGATAAVIVATGQSPASIILISFTILAASGVGLSVYRTLSPLAAAEQAETPSMVGGRTRVGLEREKTLILRSIKELEFDYAMKKVAQADYDEMSTRLRSRAMRLMQQLEAGTGYRDEIEKELLARLAGTPGIAGLTSRATERATEPVMAPAREDVEHADPQPDDVARDVSHTCACGTTNDPDARFCKNCGSKLQRPA